MKITVDDNYCKGCAICVKVCPRGVFAMSSKKRSQRGYLMPEVVSLDKCVMCHLCENMCPDMCINIDTEEDSGNEE